MFAVLKEFCEFLWEQKKLWLLPIVVILLIAGLVVTVTTSSAIAPFIYTLF